MQALEKLSSSNSWITLVLMFLFFGLVLLKGINSNRLKGSVYSLLNINFVETELEENASFFDVFQIVIFVFSVIVISLLTFNFKTYTLASDDVIFSSFSSFLSVFLILLTYFLFLKIVSYLLSNLFLIKNEVRFFIISKSNYLYAISILLYIALVLSEYTNLNQNYLFYFAGFLFLMRFIIHVVSNKNLIFSKLFYFILYLCAFEIAPLFILFKLMF